MNTTSTRTEAISLAKRFVKEELIKNAWFRKLHADKAYSLIILTGSVVQGNKDSFSDLDLFVIVPYKNQVKYKLSPEYTYKYEGVAIEISLVTTEKLESDQMTKKHVYWWKGSVPIVFTNKKYLSVLKKAGTLSREDVKDHLWTLMVLFEMNIVDMERIVERADPLSFNLNLYDCLRLFGEFMLLDIGIAKRFKWYGKLIEENFPAISGKINEITNEKDSRKALIKLKELRVCHKEMLAKNGFTKNELDNWSGYNLKRLLFQRF